MAVSVAVNWQVSAWQLLTGGPADPKRHNGLQKAPWRNPAEQDRQLRARAGGVKIPSVQYTVLSTRVENILRLVNPSSISYSVRSGYDTGNARFAAVEMLAICILL